MTMKANRPRDTRDKVRAYRARMRARGLRPVKIWLPDTRTAPFKDEAHRHSLAVAQTSLAQRDHAFIYTISYP